MTAIDPLALAAAGLDVAGDAGECNHVCCESRRTPFHAHFVAVDDCSPCRRIRALEGEAAIARGAEMGRAFVGVVGRNSPGGAATGSPTAPAAPSGQPDPAERIARAFVLAVQQIGTSTYSPKTVEIVLASEIRLALRSYR